MYYNCNFPCTENVLRWMYLSALSSHVKTNGLLQQSSQNDLQLTTETPDYQEDSEDNTKRAYRFVSWLYIFFV